MQVSGGATGVFAGARQVAVVGSGPSGCYAAAALRKRVPSAQVVVFESLPVPYGLVRLGVAPDHQGTKAVSRQFHRTLSGAGVTFVGNVTVGRDLPPAALCEAFDAVVLATGLPYDRPLPVDVADGARVFGAGAVMRFLNGDPDSALGGSGRLGRDVIVVGNGNVALDVARLLLKCREELTGSDIDDAARDALGVDEVRSVQIIGRGTPDAAKWDAAMLKELLSLDRARDGRRLEFTFGRTPVRTGVGGGRTLLVTEPAHGTGEPVVHEADTVITAIGFTAPAPDPALATLPPHLARRLFRVGGPRTGVLGTLAANRRSALTTADEVARFLAEAPETGQGLAALGPAVEGTATSFADWLTLDALELARAPRDRCRRKLTTRADMLTALGRHPR